MKARQVISKEDLRGKSSTGFLNFPNQPLMGVYNIKTGEVFLWPCIKEKLGLVRADTREPFKYDRGYRLDKNLQMIMGKGKLTPEEMNEVNQSQFIPRVVADTIDDLENDISKNRITGHEYILELCGELESLRDYRGFTIIQNDGKVEYIWDSGALNSPYDANGVRQRQRGAKVSEEHQEKIKAVIEMWANTIPERFVSLTNFIANITTKENKDFWIGKAPTFMSTIFLATSTEVPSGIIEIRNIIKDKSLTDKERMPKIIKVAHNELAKTSWAKQDAKVVELFKLLAGGSNNFPRLVNFYERTKSDLKLAPPQAAPAAGQ